MGRLSDNQEEAVDATSLHIERVPASLRNQVVVRLRDAITEGIFPPGQRMIERDICARLDVSRPLVREALRQLEAEGLIDIVPHRGPIVRSLTAAQAVDLYDIRSLLEGQCVRACAQRATPADIALLRECTERLVGALLARDPSAIIPAKKQYYDALLTACHSPPLADYLRQLSARLSQFWSSSINVPGRVKEGVAELRDIMRAIERRDHDAAFAAGSTFARHARRQQARLAGVEDTAGPPAGVLPRPSAKPAAALRPARAVRKLP
jgi:DNA-binding GntR family transcriptional regulator